MQSKLQYILFNGSHQGLRKAKKSPVKVNHPFTGARREEEGAKA